MPKLRNSTDTLLYFQFGLLAQLLTDYMYRRGRYQEAACAPAVEDRSGLDTLLGLARSEATLVPSLTAMAKDEVTTTNRGPSSNL